MALPPELLAAYRRTHYVVHARGGDITLRIGESSAEFDALLAEQGVPAAALMTAFNPGSELVGAAANAAAQARLLADLRAGGWSCLPSQARDPRNRWPAEATVAVPGIEQAAAAGLARRYGQNAFVWTALHAAAELIVIADE